MVEIDVFYVSDFMPLINREMDNATTILGNAKRRQSRPLHNFQTCHNVIFQYSDAISYAFLGIDNSGCSKTLCAI